MALQFIIDISDADIPFFMDAVKRAEQRAVGKSAEEVIEAAEKTFVTAQGETIAGVCAFRACRRSQT
jgi:hypothetical protein